MSLQENPRISPGAAGLLAKSRSSSARTRVKHSPVIRPAERESGEEVGSTARSTERRTTVPGIGPGCAVTFCSYRSATVPACTMDGATSAAQTKKIPLSDLSTLVSNTLKAAARLVPEVTKLHARATVGYLALPERPMYEPYRAILMLVRGFLKRPMGLRHGSSLRGEAMGSSRRTSRVGSFRWRRSRGWRLNLGNWLRLSRLKFGGSRHLRTSNLASAQARHRGVPPTRGRQTGACAVLVLPPSLHMPISTAITRHE